MQQLTKKFLIADREATAVPFNYMIAKYPVQIGEKVKLDIAKGRHKERTFGNIVIQNPTASKAFFYKPISRYDVRF